MHVSYQMGRTGHKQEGKEKGKRRAVMQFMVARSPFTPDPSPRKRGEGSRFAIPLTPNPSPRWRGEGLGVRGIETSPNGISLARNHGSLN
jgi:hypothetical protein